MGEAALKMEEQEYASQLDEARAIKARQRQPESKRPKGQVIQFPGGRDASNTEETESDEEGGQVIQFPTGESREAMAERLNADRARSASQQASLGFDPNVERFAQAGNLSEATMADATARVAEMTQRMRQATTLAELSALRLEYMALNNELTEAGLEDQKKKMMEEGRAWMWRLIADGGPAIDAATFGSDCGFFTLMSDGIVTWQFLYGRFLYGKDEPDNLHNLFVPPPTRTKPADNDPDGMSIPKRAMVWWDTLVFVITFIAENGMVILMGCILVLLMYGLYCLSIGTVAAAQDSICPTFASLSVNASGTFTSETSSSAAASTK